MKAKIFMVEANAHHERVYRRNFFLLVLDGILFMVALGLIGSTTVIPDFVRRLTDSEILIGLSGSLFEVGWTLPQLFIARYVVRFERKKWLFAGPNIPVRLIILTFAGLMVLLGAERPGAILAVFLFCYGIAAIGDGVVGVPWADIAGTSLDSRWRARMFGLMSGIAGIIMLGVTPLIGIVLSDPNLPFPNNYALLFAGAGVLFAISIIPPIFLIELPGSKAVEKIATMGEFLPALGKVLRNDVPFRAIIITRMLTTLFAMAAPFYVGFATVQLGLSSTEAVPILIAMQTVGTICGAFIYMWLGARSNLLYIRVALAGASLLPICALIASVVGPLPLYFGFLMSGLALSNLSFGYQNWVISYAAPDQRPIYAGLFNTVAAVIAFTAPFIAGTIVQNVGYEVLFMVSIVMIFSALFVTLRYLQDPKKAAVAPAAAMAAE